jgi:hypothetical protein
MEIPSDGLSSPENRNDLDDDGGVLTADLSNLTLEERYELWNNGSFRSTKIPRKTDCLTSEE